MRLEVLELIAAIVKYGSISAAARNCHIQQTTLSAAVRSVESELDIQIFERQYNGVILTPHGEELMKRALPMLDLYREMQHINHIEDRLLLLHINRFLYSYFCYDVMPELQTRFPGPSMAVSMAEENPLQNPMANDFHIGIGCCSPGEWQSRKRQAREMGLTLTKLFTSEFVAYVSKDSPLGSLQELGTSETLRGQSVIFANSVCKDMFFQANLTDVVGSYSIMDPFDPVQMLHSVSRNKMLAFAVDRRLIPSRFYPELENVVCLPIVEPNNSSRRYMQHYLICREHKHRAKNERELVDFIINKLRDLESG